MKKKAFSLMLVLAMLLGMIGSVPVVAAVNDTYGMKLVGVERNDQSGITLYVWYQGPDIAKASSVMFSVDASKLLLAREEDHALISLNATLTSVTQATSGKTPLKNYTSYADTTSLFAMETNGRQLFMPQQTINTGTTISSTDPEWEPEVDENGKSWIEIAHYEFNYADDQVSSDDLDSNTIVLCNTTDAYNNSQPAVAVLANSTQSFYYGVVNSETHSESLDKPTITYPNSTVRAIESAAITLAKTEVNTPVELPTAGSDVTVAVDSATAADVAGISFDSGDITWQYTVADKSGDPLSDKISIDASTGTVTIKAGAPVCTLVVTGTASYNKGTDKGTSTKAATAELKLLHGTAADETVTKEYSGIVVTKGGTVVVTSAAGSTYTETASIPTTDSNTYTFVAKAVDQYGDDIAGTVLEWKDSDHSSKNPSFIGGVVTVAPSATPGNYAYSVHDTGDKHTATVTIKVTDYDITWPTLTKDTITYGEAVNSFTLNTTAAVVMHQGSDVTSDYSFVWDVTNPAETIAAGTSSLKLKCVKTADSALADVKVYAVTVNKADQVIGIVTDTAAAPAASIDVGQGDTLDLEATVKSAVTGDSTGNTISYNITTSNGATVTADGVVSPGTAGTQDTLTISVLGDSNYNDETRTVTVYSQKAFLHATISFDKKDPKFGEVITATITEDSGQANSLTTAVTYQWGYIDTENGNKFEAITNGNLTAPASTPGGSTTVQYTPTANEVGKLLALQVITPTDDPGYNYAHSVQEAMANAVIKAKWGTPAATVKTKTATTVELNPVVIGETIYGEGGEVQYAIAKDNGGGSVTPLAVDDPSTLTLNWGTAATFTGLDPNTAYTVFVKITTDNAREASDIQQFDVTTEKIKLDPDGPSADPKVEYKDEADKPSVTLSGTAEYGEKLTATASPAKFDITIGGTTTTKTVQYDVFTWKRQALNNDGTDNGEPAVITGATTDEYTLTAADIGCKIIVEVSPSDTDYSGSVAATSATVEKADATLNSEGFDTVEESRAGEADGKITISDPADDTAAYEIRLKVDSGSPNTYQDAVVTAASGDDPAFIGGLGAGVYELRLKETSTHKASDPVEIEVKTLGYNITGLVTSYNAKKAITYTLYDSSNAKVTGHIEAVLVAAEATTTVNATTVSFTITGVVNGTYKLVISKDSHCDFVITNIVVNDGDVDLTKDSRTKAQNIVMGAGDLEGSNSANIDDLNELIDAANYNGSLAAAANKLTDIDGSGDVNIDDLNILLDSAFYNHSTDIDYTI